MKLTRYFLALLLPAGLAPALAQPAAPAPPDTARASTPAG